jgi:HSP20 family protein
MQFFDRRQLEQLRGSDPEIERRFKQLLGSRQEGLSEEQEFAPPADVFLCEEGLVILVELAGICREDIRLAMSDEELEIHGRRREPKAFDKERFFALECAFGPFRRRFRLPGGLDTAAIEANYSEGFLTIRVPRLAGGSVGWQGEER